MPKNARKKKTPTATIEAVYHCPQCGFSAPGEVARGTSFDDDQAYCPECGARMSALHVSPDRLNMIETSARILYQIDPERMDDLRTAALTTDLAEMPIQRARLRAALNSTVEKIDMGDGSMIVFDAAAALTVPALDYMCLLAHCN